MDFFAIPWSSTFNKLRGTANSRVPNVHPPQIFGHCEESDSEVMEVNTLMPSRFYRPSNDETMIMIMWVHKKISIGRVAVKCLVFHESTDFAQMCSVLEAVSLPRFFVEKYNLKFPCMADTLPVVRRTIPNYTSKPSDLARLNGSNKMSQINSRFAHTTRGNHPVQQQTSENRKRPTPQQTQRDVQQLARELLSKAGVPHPDKLQNLLPKPPVHPDSSSEDPDALASDGWQKAKHTFKSQNITYEHDEDCSDITFIPLSPHKFACLLNNNKHTTSQKQNNNNNKSNTPCDPITDDVAQSDKSSCDEQPQTGATESSADTTSQQNTVVATEQLPVTDNNSDSRPDNTATITQLQNIAQIDPITLSANATSSSVVSPQQKIKPKRTRKTNTTTTYTENQQSTQQPQI